MSEFAFRIWRSMMADLSCKVLDDNASLARISSMALRSPESIILACSREFTLTQE